jgi:glycine dehydrogenase subunit 1
MSFVSHTPEDRTAMLKKIGVASFEELLQSIPSELRFRGDLNLPPPLSELEAARLLSLLAGENKNLNEFTSFLGGGAYDHAIPAVINHILLRSEFYTAYTPYQVEVSQGTLQAIYEFQSLICELFDMEISNASMYDGASAFAEACHMARGISQRDEILVAETVNPNYIKVIKTYCQGLGIPVRLVPARDGAIDVARLAQLVTGKTATLLVQHPNFFGCLEPVFEIEPVVHGAGALLTVSVDPISLATLAPPGDYKADIATAEGQPLGLSPGFGGPYLGIFTTKKDHVRFMPGRLIGRTVDQAGKPGFVMTLQTREQHIRRQRATSNICTNEALCALAATVYLSLLGKEGLREVAEQCLLKSHYLAQRIAEVKGYALACAQPFFKEFVVETPVPAEKIVNDLIEEKIFAGIDLGRFNPEWQNRLLIAVTEKRTREDLDRLVTLLSRYSRTLSER